MASKPVRPWKQQLRKLPANLIAQLASVKSETVVVAATKTIAVKDLAFYSHLGLTEKTFTAGFTTQFIPNPSNGIISRRNSDGWEVVRKDLPMIKKTFYWETPNFGDAATYGTHTHSRTRDIYQRTYFEPPMISLSLLVDRTSSDGKVAIITLKSEQVLDRSWSTFDERLLFNVNLLQENFGAAAVFPAAITTADLAKEITLNWEIFPPGTAAPIIEVLLRKRSMTREQIGIVERRIKLFNSLRPAQLLVGTGGFNSYIGAQFASDLVVFENMNYGNAIYILYENWQELSQRSRVELLKGTDKSYTRIVHGYEWEETLKTVLQNEIRKRRKP